ncbi:tripartite tricarboxylate transporter TctB family protein [Puniceibacterium sediminis]|uniref:Tripartite tricarboxylate transporter TctB family protein n=1 Tax=Puniceibacterium sediminis TaxID=1608407 RepID=A0A238X7L9_9RHOB|nr:tripartite tricarboxylate transporter TctB family protein [Puniceibacterium sediminis]SNR54571.1 Tripartite tricarboxylate transporter TctB family protein [Puniceibacterium sediminis]
MTTPVPEHHDGTSDATPGGYEDDRRPGELGFALIMLAASLGLFWSAYDISGFEALSAPGAIPMATTFAMVVTALIVVLRTARLPLIRGEGMIKDILPVTVVVMVLFLLGYALLLRPLGFLPTSALFLIAAIKMLSRRSWGFTLVVGLGSLVVVWLIFRIVFSVLMPAGVMPEAEFIQYFRNLIGGRV